MQKSVFLLSMTCPVSYFQVAEPICTISSLLSKTFQTFHQQESQFQAEQRLAPHAKLALPSNCYCQQDSIVPNGASKDPKQCKWQVVAPGDTSQAPPSTHRYTTMSQFVLQRLCKERSGARDQGFEQQSFALHLVAEKMHRSHRHHLRLPHYRFFPALAEVLMEEAP